MGSKFLSIVWPILSDYLISLQEISSIFFFFHRYCSLSFISSTSNEFLSKKKKEEEEEEEEEEEVPMSSTDVGEHSTPPIF